ncbi:MAG: hypothetical protein KA436_09980 [Oligoflexales bacterium]|nr:hypothetical protein [Oligoflexales bacterium]
MKSTGQAKFLKSKSPRDEDIDGLVARMSQLVIKVLRKLGYLKDLSVDELPTDPLFELDPTYAACMSASVKNQIALGERQGGGFDSLVQAKRTSDQIGENIFADL